MQTEPDPSAVLRAFIAQVNAAIAPLRPFFDVLDLMRANVDAVTKLVGR